MDCTNTTHNAEENDPGKNKSKNEVLEQVKRYIREYCESSSIQGLSYFSGELSFSEG